MSAAKKRDTRDVKHYTEEEWKARAVELFGEDPMRWRFRCPVCSYVQSAHTLREFRDRGATPSSAYQECKGRFSGGKTNLGATSDRGAGCDYAAFGLLRFGDLVGETPVFPFDEGGPGEVKT